IFTISCEDDSKKPTDTLSTGSIDISVDETYRPIIEDELKVFDSSYPEARITPHYKPEAECIKDFLNDSTRLILVTRSLNADALKMLEQKKVVATSLAVAKDAVAVVLNNSSKDTMLSVSQL